MNASLQVLHQWPNEVREEHKFVKVKTCTDLYLDFSDLQFARALSLAKVNWSCGLAGPCKSVKVGGQLQCKLNASVKLALTCIGFDLFGKDFLISFDYLSLC